MNDMEEIWVYLTGTNKRIKVSNFGNVKRIFNGREKLICNSVKNRYKKFFLATGCKRAQFRVHRSVASMFIPNPDSKPCVNHKDGNKHNNHVDNLEWCTVLENNRHAQAIGLAKTAKKRVLLATCDKKIRRRPVMKGITGEIYFSVKEAAIANGIKSYGNIATSIKGTHGHLNKMQWRYLTDEEIANLKAKTANS